MITVKRLRQILAKVPDNWQVNAYEGEGIGMVIRKPNLDRTSAPQRGDTLWIEARDSETEDIQEPWANEEGHGR